MHADLESIVCKFGGDPAICLRELIGCKFTRIKYIVYIVDKLIAIPRAAAIAGGRSNYSS